MKIVDNVYDEVTISLEASDCFRLAQALRLAEGASQQDEREDLAQLWSTTAALFEALSMISVVHRHVPGRSSLTFHEEFNLPQVQTDILRDLEHRPESEKAA